MKSRCPGCGSCGLVDAHVHIPGFLLSSRLDDFTSASKAAAAGGVTTVLLMPTDDPRTATPFDFYEQKRDNGIGRSYIDYAIQAIVGPMSESINVSRHRARSRSNYFSLMTACRISSSATTTTS